MITKSLGDVNGATRDIYFELNNLQKGEYVAMIDIQWN